MPPTPHPSRWLPRPERNDAITPDRTELWIRFVLGAVIGTVAGLRLTTWLEVSSVVGSVAMVLGTGLHAGTLAWWKGDRFWRSLRASLPF